MKFDVIGSEFYKLPKLTLRIQDLFTQRFVQRLYLLHKINIFYPTQDHLSKKMNIESYLENSIAFKNTGFIFAHPMGGMKEDDFLSVPGGTLGMNEFPVTPIRNIYRSKNIVKKNIFIRKNSNEPVIFCFVKIGYV